MGNAPSSSRGSTPPPSPPPPPRVPPRVHSPPPRDALALMRGQSLTSMAQPTAATSLPSPAPPTPKALAQNSEPSTPKPGAPAERALLPEQDVGESMPGELEGSPQEQRTDWSAARAAMERAIGTLRHRAEEIARDAMERRREQRAIEEEEARALHERKMTIYEDAEPGPLDELRFPPGLGRGASDSEVSATPHSSHSSEPTTETLVEEPGQITEEPEAEGLPEKVVEKSVIHEVQDVATIAQDEPEVSNELAIIPEVQVVGPEQPQVSGSGEKPAEGVPNTDEEAEASQEAAPIAQETPLVVTEEHPPDQAPLISSERLPSVLEEASDTQSEHLSTSDEFPRPHTPHPTIDDPRAASPVPFPQTSEPEDQGYGTQEDEDRATKVSPRAPGPGKRVHWGGVEAQPAYARAQDEEDHGEEHSPPFSRLLLPAPAPAPAPVEPQREVRAERPARIAVRRTVPAPVQKPMRKLEPGLYTATDVRWGMALDLSSADHRSLIAFGLHGWENQQVSVVVVVLDSSPAGEARADRDCSWRVAHTAVGVPALRRWFRYQERQQRLVPHSRGPGGTPSGQKHRGHNGGLPDVLGNGGHGQWER
ncbi:hypothetical protein BJV78DRAFT_418666 [Lactifluus subvellereus]|nr:hypothetical protein BJV78DRAFT_418666 [Lactifluus subvellereus]